jgi:phospholipid-binding lipoprotein MlaA
MKKNFARRLFIAAVVTVVLACAGLSMAEVADPLEDDPAFAWGDDPLDYFEEEVTIADPLESMNRVFFAFNDWMYVWFLKPVSASYAKVVPTVVRTSIGNFFHNLRAPIRVVNNVLQVKPKETGIELSRFLINTTMGVGGLGDPARKKFGIEPRVEDLGQTLGYYGIGGGIFIVWPFLGASNLRDSIGLVGDSFLSPVDYYIREDPLPGAGVLTLDYVNWTSFRIDDYDQFKAIAFDPYLAMRDAYQQYRQSMIEDRNHRGGSTFYSKDNHKIKEDPPAASNILPDREIEQDDPAELAFQNVEAAGKQMSDDAGADLHQEADSHPEKDGGDSFRQSDAIGEMTEDAAEDNQSFRKNDVVPGI